MIQKKPRVRVKKTIGTLLAAACGLAGSVATAEPGRIDAGPFKVEPALNTQLAYIDNIYRAKDDEDGSMVLTISPAMVAFIENGASRYEAHAEVRSETYFAESDDDTLDVEFGIDLHHVLSNKQALDFFAGMNQTHEDRGAGLSQGGIGVSGNDEPIEYDETTVGGRYTLGSNQTLGKLVIELSDKDKEYQNFRDTTEFFDHDTWTTSTALYYNLSGKTALVAEGRWEDVEYDQDKPGFASLDAEEFTALVGVTWQATGKTTGHIKLGYFDREFDSASREDSDDLRWDAAITWAPRTYSTLTFTAAQTSDETRGFDPVVTGDFIERETVSLTWDHAFDDATSMSIGYTSDNDEYSGSSGREDERTRFSAGVKRALDRWIVLKAGYEYEELDSSNDPLSYDRNTFFIGLDMTL